MTLNPWIAIWIAFAVLAFPTLSLADHHEAGEEAAEDSGEMAAEESDAQSDEDNEGSEGDDQDEKGSED